MKLEKAPNTNELRVKKYVSLKPGDLFTWNITTNLHDIRMKLDDGYVILHCGSYCQGHVEFNNDDVYLVKGVLRVSFDWGKGKL